MKIEKALCNFPPSRSAASFSSYPIGLSFSSTRTKISGIFLLLRLSRWETLFFCLSNPSYSGTNRPRQDQGIHCRRFLPPFVTFSQYSTGHGYHRIPL